MITLDIHPYDGALPLRFGVARNAIHQLLGAPERSLTRPGRAGTVDFWRAACLNVSYDRAGRLDHVGLSPGDLALSLLGAPLWSPEHPADPNPALLRLDPDPVETLGFLVFLRLGVTTTGFHDGDVNQQAITVFRRGAWDHALAKPPTPTRRGGRRGPPT